MHMPIRRFPVLGCMVSETDQTGAVAELDRWIGDGVRSYVCATGAHGVVESQRDADLLRIHNEAGLVVADGMPLVWVGRLKGFAEIGHVYGPELMLAVCQQGVTKGYRHFLYGGGAFVADMLASKLRERFPGIAIAGTMTPPFGAETPILTEAEAGQINAARADIIWVGLSTPKQERWMAANRARLDAPVMAGVGAAFDFIAELKPREPAWLLHTGFTWCFRLLTEPRRLWRRYARIVPLFIWFNVLEQVGLRRRGERSAR